ncbi:NitT/TauT family transport system ATP-binding protein [Mesorhizobium soli]|uniref:ABC transporter ATP-binding protein n=1 Tax=Pseudaminobacter soli (ex Li et al. 2025) TaxID=1295366 RepID=UPI0024751713|nr:ABC transporter ATP-binding protein [Mesorhizobium soli]MDH6233433.1 NitT/TauT family transport system ATP-binding protein [Mesorhizobium soli]
MNMVATPSPSAQPLIQIENVYKQYGTGVVAVRDMSLTIEQGQFVSFLGPSGCGKSTALRMIAGLSEVSAGKIRVNGHEPGKGSGPHDIGFVFQEPTLMPWATVFENVYLPLRLSGMSRKDATPRIEEVLAQVGLTKFAKAYPRELSGGMKMRVSIARALATRPRLLLMDEPFAALDEMTRFKLNNDVLRLWQEHGLTVIFVTHSVYESVYLSNRVVVMAARPGRVVADIAIPGAYPRAENFRTTKEYTDSCQIVSDALNETLGTDDIDH